MSRCGRWTPTSNQTDCAQLRSENLDASRGPSDMFPVNRIVPLAKETVLRRLVCITLVASAFLSAAAALAEAEGGMGIATAPAVTFGLQEFGNLTTPDAHCVYASWWQLPVVTGDTVQIDWEVHNEGIHLHVWAPGTTEFNFETRESLKLVPNANLKTESTFPATQTGNMPIRFAIAEQRCPSVNVPGPYSFTAYVTHALSLALPHIAALHDKGTLAVAVHDPSGGLINDPAVQVQLQCKGRGGWQTIGRAPVVDSVAAVRFMVPMRQRHQQVTLRAVARGTGYVPASTAHLKVRTL